MEKIGLYQYHFRPGQFDFKNRISFIHLINSILDAAGKHAEANNFGIEDLISNGKTWILSRILFEFVADQPYSKNLFIETWVDKIDEVFTNRRFNIYDEKKNVFASACTKWAMIDIKSRRFLHLRKYLDDNFVVKDKDLLCSEPTNISIEKDNYSFLRKVETLYSDIDINKHVTSTRYVQIILDAFDLDYHKNNHIKKCEINFLSEVLYGDIIEVRKIQLSENEFVIDLMKQSDSKIASRCKILWVC